MNGTCDYKNCKLFDLLGGQPEQCPNYTESWWTPGPQATDRNPILVKDCAPKRTFLMIQELSNRLVGVQQSQEELRNETVWVQAVAEVIGKNIKGINLEAFVDQRRQLNNIKSNLLEE